MAVQGTNDSSTLSKSSAVRSGYFRDEFITFFVGKQTRRSSLIHRGYYVRVLAVDSIVQHFLRSTSEPQQIISFGAGFDSTFFRLKSRGALTDTVYVEVDFPDVVARKVVMIKGQRKLNELLEHPLQQRQEVYTSPGYSMIGLDLEHVEKLSGFLPQCGVEFDRPTLLLSECVLTYITDKSANRIIRWSASTFPNALFVTYEQVHPNDGFGLVMQKHFTTIGSPLKCINVYPTPQTQEERYLRMGWECSVARDMHYFYYHFQSEEDRRRINTLELFDEFEEFHMKCSHYVIVCSAKGSSLGFLKHLQLDNAGRLNPVKYSLEHCSRVTAEPLQALPEGSCKQIQRYGQCSVWMPRTSSPLVYGGFGHAEHTHGRLGNTTQVTVDGDKLMVKNCIIQGNPPGKLMYSTLVLLSNNSCVLFGGRGSPSSANDKCFLLRAVQGDLWEWVSMVTHGEASPEGRWRHSAAVLVNTRGEEVMVVFGGRNVKGQSLSDFWCLNLVSLLWTQLEGIGSVPCGRHSASCAVWENKMVLHGGLDGDDVPLNSLFIVALKEKEGIPYFSSEEVKMDPPLPSRYSCCGVVYGSHLVLVGGVTWDCISPHVIIVDLKALKWTSVRVKVEDVPMLLYGVSAVALPNKECSHEVQVLLLCGGGNCFSFGTHFNSCPCLITCSSETN